MAFDHLARAARRQGGERLHGGVSGPFDKQSKKIKRAGPRQWLAPGPEGVECRLSMPFRLTQGGEIRFMTHTGLGPRAAFAMQHFPCDLLRRSEFNRVDGQRPHPAGVPVWVIVPRIADHVHAAAAIVDQRLSRNRNRYPSRPSEQSVRGNAPPVSDQSFYLLWMNSAIFLTTSSSIPA